MIYQLAPISVTLSDLQGYFPITNLLQMQNFLKLYSTQALPVTFDLFVIAKSFFVNLKFNRDFKWKQWSLQNLVHTGRIQSHHRWMSKSLKNCTQWLFRVNFLWFEDFIHESLVKHNSSDVKQYCKYSIYMHLTSKQIQQDALRLQRKQRALRSKSGTACNPHSFYGCQCSTVLHLLLYIIKRQLTPFVRTV